MTFIDSLRLRDSKIDFFSFKKIKRPQEIDLFKADVLNIATCARFEGFWQQANLMIGTSKFGLIGVYGFLET